MDGPVIKLNYLGEEKIHARRTVIIVTVVGISLMLLMLAEVIYNLLSIPSFSNKPREWVPIIVFIPLALFGLISGIKKIVPGVNRYYRRRAGRILGRRRDAILDVNDPDLVFVKIVSDEAFKEKTNRVVLETAQDAGFLKFDVAGRRVLYEGQEERWILCPGDVREWRVEKTLMPLVQEGEGADYSVHLIFHIGRTPDDVTLRRVEPLYSSSKYDHTKREKMAHGYAQLMLEMFSNGPA